MQSRTPDRRCTACIVCGHDEVSELIRVASVPTLCNQLFRDPEKARQVSRATIDVVGCHYCGHVFNAAFDPGLVDYSDAYENSLMGSPRYRQYTKSLVEDLLARYDLVDGTAVEIGCGRGEFLSLLCDGGMRRAIGFDPGRTGEKAAVGNPMVTIVGAPFDSSIAPNADLVCSRHVLEHLPSPVSLLRDVRTAYSGSEARAFFFEVPNGCYTTDQLGIWDLVYEHVSYFTPSSLRWAMESAGLTPTRIESAFGGQFLVAEGRFGARPEPDAMPKPGPTIGPACEIADRFAAFQSGFAETLDAWVTWLDRAQRNGRRLALWGAGSKGTIFLNLLDRREVRAVQQVIDLNPLKAGTFIPGTGHSVEPPEALRGQRTDCVLLMNVEYETEVRYLLESMGVGAELIGVSGRLPPP